jgi:hypothetical protein
LLRNPKSEEPAYASPLRRGRRNPKWFDLPFENLRVLSNVEGLTSLSHVEGQLPVTRIPIPKPYALRVLVLNTGIFVL